MFLGYCYQEDLNQWMPPVHLETAEDAHAYCNLQRHMFMEVRITDHEDHCLMFARDHVLHVMFEDGLLHRFDMKNRVILEPVSPSDVPDI